MSASQFLGIIPFYLTWDLDGIFQPKVSTERNEDDRHNKKLMVGSKQTVQFRYQFPAPLRQYVESSTVAGLPWDSDNVKDCYVKIFVSYPVDKEIDVSRFGKFHYSMSASQFLGIIAFNLTWDLDGIFQPKVSTERNEDDRHNKKLMVGSKQTVQFRYQFPAPLQQYVESSTVAGLPWDSDNVKDCYVKIFVSYPVDKEIDVSRFGTFHYSVSASQFLGIIPFYLTWDLDGIFQPKVSTERNEDDRHNKKLMVGSKQTVQFRYQFPAPLRQYVESSTVAGLPWDTDNIKDCYVKIFGDKFPYRVPGWFNGTCGTILEDIAFSDVEGKYPFQILLTCTCYVNCIFKGITSN